MSQETITHRVSRGAFYLAVEKLSAMSSGILYLALVLRWLGAYRYGILVLALAVAGMAATASGNLEMYLERYAAEYLALGRLKTLRRAHLLALAGKLLLGVAAAFVMVALSPAIAHFYHRPELIALLPWLAALVAFDGLWTTGRATLFGLERFRVMSLIALVFNLLKVLLVGALWASHEATLVPLAIGLSALAVAQGAVASAVPLWMLRRAADPPGPAPEGGTGPLARHMVRYCTPLLLARVSFLSSQNLSVIVLGKLFDPGMLGLYASASRVIERFIEVANTLPTALLPSLTQLWARGERDRLQTVLDHAFRLGQAGSCALALLLFLFAREMMLLAGSPLFVQAIPIFMVLALVPVARTAQQPLTMLFRAMRRPGTEFGLALIKFVSEFAGYFLLVPAIGLVGAAWANLSGAVVSYAAALIVLARILPDRDGERGRVMVKSIGLLALALVAGAWLERHAPVPSGGTLRALLAPAGLVNLAARALLFPLAVAAAFGLGLLTREDLERVSALPLKGAWMPRVRDGLVAAAQVLARPKLQRGATPVALLLATALALRTGGMA
ncbi:MAG TPA: lipopolysaccharide biosynthesis protein [Candidatus Eisenbacteria bacterium]|nr:lipopolysaccharide biosynthesis protein [Candidatus Eisenbacteria bacterium]